jgi:hypothetical protein
MTVRSLSGAFGSAALRIQQVLRGLVAIEATVTDRAQGARMLVAAGLLGTIVGVMWQLPAAVDDWRLVRYPAAAAAGPLPAADAADGC